MIETSRSSTAAPAAEEVLIASSDGARSHGTLFRCADESAPVVVCLPAMGVAASFYRPLAEALVGQGLHAFTCDHRGVGKSSVRASRRVSFGYGDMLEKDLPRAVAAARAALPGRPVYLLGHSLGGQLAALYAGAGADRVDGTILVAAGSVYFRSYRFPDSLKVLGVTQLARGLSSALGYWPGDKLGFAGREARGVIRDWSHQARTGRYEFKLGGAEAESLLARAAGEVLAISVDNDVLAPASAVDHICQKLSSARVTRWHYTAARGDRIDHFRWVKRPDPVARRVKAWIEASSRTAS